MKIALATCAELPHQDADDAPLVDALAARGAEVVHAVWDQGDAPFLNAELSVIRSTWDYTAKVHAFVAWAERVDAGSGGRLCNPASVVRWNSHKGYLLELERQGTAIVPTLVLRAGSEVDVARLLEEPRFSQGAVLKPAVSAGSRDSIRVSAREGERARAHVERLLPTRDLLVQPFVDGIDQGELSLIFLEQEGELAFAHAVNKVPARGDFRSQPEFSATISRVEPPLAWRQAAERLLSLVPAQLLYARVDLVAGPGGVPWLMELELIEPSLYLTWQPASAALLADAVLARARRARS